jgi:hypothetical protein
VPSYIYLNLSALDKNSWACSIGLIEVHGVNVVFGEWFNLKVRVFIVV